MNLLCRWPAAGAGPDPSALLPLEPAATKPSAAIAIAAVPRGEWGSPRDRHSPRGTGTGGKICLPPKKIPTGIPVPVTHGDGEGIPVPWIPLTSLPTNHKP
ncbi:hypothetical protein SLEP1_g28630 [Rubroshorea leprosula]|uniref:Uncharacterized protein n=1 Tax=Rubroshorea leprosula TaxID=152421 RepID=A0AAV5K3Q7_9ROSI|nr:hypothetical protein SLEP1_g28630 [Rubroshorea leprosula]